MKIKLLAVVGVLGALFTTAQAELKWLTDFEEGKKAAAKSDKMLLVNFTGSDWCHWCIQLKEEVFSQGAFAGAADKYVLVELDFPDAEDVITPEQRGKNEALAQELGIEGFPSIVLFDDKGRAIARTGYQPGGAEAYLKHLEEVSQPYAELRASEGESRKEALATFLKTLAGEDIEANFSKEFKELKQLDPEDETGLIGEMAIAKAMAQFEDGVEEKLAAGDFEAVLTQVDTFLAEHDPQGEKRQHVLMGKVMVYVEKGEQEKAFAEIDKMATFAPESEFTRNKEEIKKSITEHLELRAKMEEEAQAAEAAPPEEPSVVEEAEAAEQETAPTVNPEPVVE